MNDDGREKVISIQDNKQGSSTAEEKKTWKQVKNEVEETKTQCFPTKSRSLPSADSYLVIDVAFDARPPSDSDLSGIKKLLQQLFVNYDSDVVSEFSNLVVAQKFVGCVLKQDHDNDESDNSCSSSDSSDEEEPVYAVNTIVNISENQNMQCIKKIRDFLVTGCKEHYKENPSRMLQLIEDPSEQIGLIISERFINIPPQVALPSYQSLKSDIANAVLDNQKFNFTHLVLISKQLRGRGEEKQREDELFFFNPEEQLFLEISEFSYSCAPKQKYKLSDDNLLNQETNFESFHTIMVFDASALGQMISKLQTELSAT